MNSNAPYAIAPVTETEWRYGMIPSSHSAIEAQFGLAPGSVSIASAMWTKSVKRNRMTPFQLVGQKGKRKRAPAKKKAAEPSAEVAPLDGSDRLTGFLSTPPPLDEVDEAELMGWCVDIVRLARRHHYLASTADAIAVFETSVLLAGLRNRARPTPYDFQDAAVTCIEKDVVPGRRDVARLCEILLGGDRVGQVGYDALPPLARDVYDRLEPLGLDLERRTVQRVLLDLVAEPDLLPCSELLWKLRYLLPDDAVRPIMGEKRLGERPIQESWDVAIGKHQRSIIELGYEGVTVEQLLEQRLRHAVFGPDATAARGLEAVEHSILFLGSRRFTDELGERTVELLAHERTVDDAPEVLRRIRRLLAHHRATAPELPEWAASFVTTGYAHYCTLLPTAFVDEETGVRQVAAMLGFLFTLENLALSLGCDRAQLLLAVQQSHPEEPAKLALLWVAQNLLDQLPMDELRARCDELLANPLVLPHFPNYVSGFVQALEPAPGMAGFVVEVLSKAFARLPDPVLLPWLPGLIMTLRAQAAELVPTLVREAGLTFPGNLPALDAWGPPWEDQAPTGEPAALATPEAAAVGGPVEHARMHALLARFPETSDAVASQLGLDEPWAPVVDADGDDGGGSGGAGSTERSSSTRARAFVESHPAAAVAVHALFDRP